MVSIKTSKTSFDIDQFNKDLQIFDIHITYILAVYLNDHYFLFNSDGTELEKTDSEKRQLIENMMTNTPFLPITSEKGHYGYLFVLNQLGKESVNKIRILLRNVALTFDQLYIEEQIETCSLGIMESAIKAIESKDPYTRGHSERVAYYSRLIADRLDLPIDKKEVTRASLLHDIGKIGISERILSKPARLTEEEYKIIKSHAEKGAYILDPLKLFQRSITAVKHHHERYDGRGYPDQLAGEDIPMIARIISISDAFDAMTSERAYRKAFSKDIALQRIMDGAGTQFDPILVKAFGEVFTDRICKIADIGA